MLRRLLTVAAFVAIVTVVEVACRALARSANPDPCVLPGRRTP